MPLSMYQSSVPVFTRYLNQLSALVQRADAHAAISGAGPAALLQARLAPDMVPFLIQVQIADDFALRSCALLSRTDKLLHGASETGFAGLRARLATSVAWLGALAPAAFEGAARRAVSSRAGDATLTLDGDVFLLQYALPNFFFHITAAYAILRQNGVAIGKHDFDGFHAYPRA